MENSPLHGFLPFVFMQAWTTPPFTRGLWPALAIGAIASARTTTRRTEARGTIRGVFITHHFGTRNGKVG